MPRLLIEENRPKRKSVPLQFLERYAVEGDDFLHRIVTGDESWLHHLDSERNDGPWNGIVIHRPRKSRNQCSKPYDHRNGFFEILKAVYWSSF